MWTSRKKNKKNTHLDFCHRELALWDALGELVCLALEVIGAEWGVVLVSVEAEEEALDGRYIGEAEAVLDVHSAGADQGRVWTRDKHDVGVN